MNRFTPSSLLFEQELYKQAFESPEARIAARLVHLMNEAEAEAAPAEDIEAQAKKWAMDRLSSNTTAQKALERTWTKNKKRHIDAYVNHLVDNPPDPEDVVGQQGGHTMEPGQTAGGQADIAPRPVLDPSVREILDKDPDLWRRITTVAATRPNLLPTTLARAGISADQADAITGYLAQTRPGVARLKPRPQPAPAPAPEPIAQPATEPEPAAAAPSPLPAEPAPAPEAPPPAEVPASQEPPPPPSEEPPPPNEPAAGGEPEPLSPELMQALARIGITPDAPAGAGAPPPPPEPEPEAEPKARSPLQAVKDAIAKERETKAGAIKSKNEPKDEPKAEQPRRLRAKEPSDSGSPLGHLGGRSTKSDFEKFAAAPERNRDPLKTPNAQEPEAPPPPPAPAAGAAAPAAEPAVSVRGGRKSPAELGASPPPPSAAPAAAPASASPSAAPAAQPAAAAGAGQEPNNVPRDNANLEPIQRAFNRFVQLTGGRAGLRVTGQGRTSAQNIPMENVHLKQVSIVPKGNDGFVMKWVIHGQTGGDLKKAPEVVRNDGTAIRFLDRSFED